MSTLSVMRNIQEKIFMIYFRQIRSLPGVQDIGELVVSSEFRIL